MSADIQTILVATDFSAAADGVREHFQTGIGQRGQALQAAWWAQFEAYRRHYPDLAEQGYRMLRC